MAHLQPDRRVQRTQHSLHTALIALILEKGYDAVTVQDIVARANVGRSTFYAHHGDKESLLLSGLQRLRAELLAHQRDAQVTKGGTVGTRGLSFSGAFFEHAHGHRDLYQALTRHGGGTSVTAGIRRLLIDLARSEISPAKMPPRAGEIPREAVVLFTVDALLSVLLWWIERSPKLPPAEVDAIFRRLTIPALAAAGVG